VKQLTDQDAGFLYLETPETPQHVGSVSMVELPAGYSGDFFEEYKAHIASRVHLVPLLYSKLVPMPLELDHPVWVEDDSLEIDYHVRRQTVPRPGRMNQLEELVGRLHSNFLDRSRPLWEFYVIDGLENGQVAIYTKIHHAAMDGASSQLLIQSLYDPTPEPREVTPPPARGPSNKLAMGLDTLVRGAIANVVRHEIRALQFIPDALKTFAHTVLPDAETLRYEDPLKPPPLTPKTIFNVSITSQRSFAARSLPLSALKKTAKLAEVKLNDVVLAICAGALRHFLQDKKALPSQAMTAMVPMSLRDSSNANAANQNAMFICSLATDLKDPYQRLMAIYASSVGQKKLLGNLRNSHLPDVMSMGSGPLMRALIGLYSRAKLAEKLPPVGNLWISNVPGPPVPLYVCGARILSFSPCSIPFHGAALNITAESYCDSLDFGFTACRRTLPDVAQLADLLPIAFDELRLAVERQVAKAQAPKKAPAKAPRVAAKKATTALKVVPPAPAPATKAVRKPRRPAVARAAH